MMLGGIIEEKNTMSIFFQKNVIILSQMRKNLIYYWFDRAINIYV